MMNDLKILSNWERAKKAIAECKSIDVVKKIRDKAEALRAYAKQAKESLEVQNNVAEIKIRCERRIGEFSKELPKLEGGRNSRHDGKSFILKEAGIIHSERYEAIASLPEKEFERHIEEVKKSAEELTTVGVIKLARELERKERDSNLKIPELPKGLFNVIYADPPWQYEHCESNTREIENKYPTLKLEDIKNIKLPFADKAILFLWATAPKLEEAISVLNAWGFSYRTCAVWDKEIIGMGYWFRGQHELLLIGIKGEMPTPEPNVRASSVYRERRKEHSKKPEYFYELIEKYFPKGKYFEVFARNKRKNWESWGNEL